MALSPNGQMLAFSSPAGVWLQDTQTGLHLFPLDGKEGNLPPNKGQTHTAITFSEDGQYLSSARCDYYTGDLCTSTKISTWDVKTHQLVGRSHSISANVDKAAFNLKRQQLATIDGANVQFWKISTGVLLGNVSTRSTGEVESLAFSPSGSILATVSNKDIKLWDVTTGQPLPHSPFIAHTDGITSVAFSPKDTQLAATSNLDKTVSLWDINSGVPKDLTGDPQPKWSVAFSADGATLASGSLDGSILLWKPSGNNDISLSTETKNILTNVVFNPDGKIVFAGSLEGKVFVIDAKTGQFMGTLPTNIRTSQPSQIVNLALDGGVLAAGRQDGMIELWDVKTYRDLKTLVSEQPLTHFTSSSSFDKIMLRSDGQVLAASEDTIQFWNPKNGAKMSPIPYHRRPFQITYPLDLSPDGKLLAVGVCTSEADNSCYADQIQFWDVTSGKLRDYTVRTASGHEKSIYNVAFSPNGQSLALSSSDGITLWNVAQAATKRRSFSVTSRRGTCKF